MRWPWLVVAGCLVAGLRLPLRDPPSPADHLLPLYTFLSCGLAAHAYEIVRGRARPPALGILGPALAAWVVLASASLFWTSNLNEGAFSVITVALPFGALAALVGSFGLERVAPVRLGRLQVALALLFSLVACYQWQAHHLFSNRKLEVDNAYASFYRVNSLFFDPSLFGRFQALAILTIVGVLLLLRRPPRPALLVLATAGVFVGLALSYSQSSLLALDVGLVVLAAVVWRGRAIVGLGALAALVLLASLAVPTTRHKIFHTSLSGITSNRSSILSKGIDAFRRHPVAGSGLGSFARSAGTTAEERARIAPHNVVLQEAVELGVLGLIALAGIVFAILRLLLRPADAARSSVLRLILAAELAALGGQLAVLRVAVRGPDLLGRGGARRALRRTDAQGERHRHARERVDQVRGLEDPRDPEQQEPRHARDERRRPVLAIAREAHAQDDGQRQPDQDGQPDERVAAGALDQVGADEQVREAVARRRDTPRRRTRTCRGRARPDPTRGTGGCRPRARPRATRPARRVASRPHVCQATIPRNGTATIANCLIRIAVPSAAAAQPRRRRATSPNATTSGARDSASAVPNHAARSVSGLTASTAPSTRRSQGGPGNVQAAASIARLARHTRKRTSSSGEGSRRQTVASSAVPGR